MTPDKWRMLRTGEIITDNEITSCMVNADKGDDKMTEMADLYPHLPKKPPPDITWTRQTTHGDFKDNARISQTLKTILREQPGWNRLALEQHEALDMIALKISRICSNSYHKDHWDDIEGYARLGGRACTS